MLDLKKGSKGPQVKRLQKIIGAKADGIFGPATEKLLISFQKLQGLTPTGQVNPLTLAELEYEESRELPTAGKKQRVKLGIVIGHTKKAPGAVLIHNKVSEYPFNTEIANLVKEAAAGSDIDVSIYTRDVGGIKGAYGKAEKDLCDCLIELHFNSTAKTQDVAAYTLTLVTSDAEDKIFGQWIQNSMAKSLGRTKAQNKALSVLSRGARGSSNVHSFQGPNCLVEPAFGNNPTDSKLLWNSKQAYAKGLLEGVKLWAQAKGLL